MAPASEDIIFKNDYFSGAAGNSRQRRLAPDNRTFLELQEGTGKRKRKKKKKKKKKKRNTNKKACRAKSKGN